MSETLLNLLNSNVLETISMTTSNRRASLADFLDEPDVCHKNNYYSQNDNIAKNQQEFGHRKRIKP
jgi:hypothetical protein